MRRLALTATALLGLTGASCTFHDIELYLSATAPTRAALSDERLERLRICESTDNYQAVSPGGWYRGAYQFDFRTWDSVASRHFPWLVQRDPVDVEPWWQDAMARALYSERGREPWPVCGRRL